MNSLGTANMIRIYLWMQDVRYILVTAYGFELSLFWSLAIAVGYFGSC